MKTDSLKKKHLKLLIFSAIIIMVFLLLAAINHIYFKYITLNGTLVENESFINLTDFSEKDIQLNPDSQSKKSYFLKLCKKNYFALSEKENCIFIDSKNVHIKDYNQKKYTFFMGKYFKSEENTNPASAWESYFSWFSSSLLFPTLTTLEVEIISSSNMNNTYLDLKYIEK